MRALNILVLLAIVLLLFLLIIVLIGYIMFKASIWLGVGYIMILIVIIIYLLYKQIEKYWTYDWKE